MITSNTNNFQLLELASEKQGIKTETEEFLAPHNILTQSPPSLLEILSYRAQYQPNKQAYIFLQN
ncbi:MAG: hypothetical protein AAFS12_08215, partial [Cyanobacteria bacterium J06632_19]